MKLDELLKAPLLEGTRLKAYEELLPLLLIREEGESSPGDGGTPPDVVPETPPVAPPTRGDAGWYRPGPFRPGGGMNGNHWFNEFYNAIKSLVVSKKILSRMKEIGISSDGQKRIKMAAKTAAKHVNLLLSNPGATAYKIPVWTFDKPKAPKIKRWNEAFAYEFKVELEKLNEQQIVD